MAVKKLSELIKIDKSNISTNKIVKLSDIIKEDQSHIDIKATNLIKAEELYKEQLEKEKKSKKEYKNALTSAGVTTGDGAFLKPSPLHTTKENVSNAFNNAIEEKKNTGKVTLPTAKDTLLTDSKTAKENTAKYNKVNETSQEYKNYENDYYRTTPLLKYQLDAAKVDFQDEFGSLETATTGFKSGLDTVFTQRSYKDENGNLVTLPSYNQLKSQKISEKSGTLGKLYQSVTSSIGAMLPSIAVGVVTGGIGTALGGSGMIASQIGSLGTTFLTASHTAYNNSLLNGKDPEKAKLYGITSGAVEVFTELLFGGMGKAFGVGALDDVVVNRLTKNINNTLAKTLAQNGLKAGGEGVEELIAGLLDPVAQKLTGISEEDLGALYKDSNLLEQFVSGILTSAVMQIPSFKNQYKVNEVNKIQNMLNNSDNNILTPKANTTPLNEITTQPTNNVTSTSELPLNNQINPSTSNLPLLNTQNNNSTNELINQQTQGLTTQPTNALADQQSPLNTQLNDLNTQQNVLNNNAQNTQLTNNSLDRYQYVPTDNVKQNNFMQSASKYLDNSQKSEEFVSIANKLISQKNYNIVFDDTIVNKDGVSVNALVTDTKDGVEIRLNPNSDRAGEFLLLHEISHLIKTPEMIKLVNDFAEKNPAFAEAKKSLESQYGKEFTSEEVFADISGQLFGNQEFINSLTNQNTVESKNIIKRIYESIKTLLNSLTEEGRYKNFVQDLETKWRTAYRNTTTEQAVNNLNSNTQYHLSENALNEVYEAIYNPDINPTAMVKLRDYTPRQLVEFGVTDLPMLVRKGHLRENILTIQEAIKMGYSIKGKHFHGLGIDTYMKAIDSLDNPTAVYQYSDKGKYSKNNFIVLTEISDANGNNIIVPIEINKKGHYNNVEIDINRIKTTYGRETTNYFSNKVNKGELVEIYNKKRSTESSVQFGSYSTSLANNISQSNNNVNSDTSSTKYSMQESENNTQELDNSSFLINSDGKNIDISNLKENATMERFHYNRKYNKNDIVTYRGTSENTGENGAFYGLGLYTTLDKNYAKKYGNVQQVDSSLLPNNPLIFKTQNDFGIWEQELARELGIKKSHLYSDNYGVEQYIKKLGYDGLMIGTGKYTDLISFTDVATKYSQDNSSWQDHLESNYKATGTRTKLTDINAKTTKKHLLPAKNTEIVNPKKVMNPLEISKLTKENANTTPTLPTKNHVSNFDGESKFWNNIKNKTNMLSEDSKSKILNDKEIKYYDKVTNKENLDIAFKKLSEGGETEVRSWLEKKSEKANATDVAEGWILLKRYADNGQHDDMVTVAKHLKDIGTKSGQTIQMFNLIQRMTPEGMVKYAQSELTEAYDVMRRGKSEKWVESNREKFDLKPDEVAFIMNKMEEVATMNDGYDKRVKLAEIQKVMQDKLPPEKGANIKAWMRISMLFNPKTQIRNILGNAIITPVNAVGDLIASGVDKAIAKKTGVRTTGSTNVKSYYKGFKTGLYQSYNDFKKGINTRNIEGNRFEIGQGKSFKDNNVIGKSLNYVDRLLSFLLDAGDRGFYEASFTNSINNQLVLNKTSEVTQQMVDIATQEALSRTWQDNNKYTQSVLNIRSTLNLNKNGYGVGDVLIPFAKTPANLTKAIVDYSPAGLVQTLVSGKTLKNALSTGDYTAKMQHDFVQKLGKATAGTMLYVIGTALAIKGITGGKSDEDKDVSNFLKNTLGVNSYSIKIGNKTFTYDWMQPIAAPLAITSNLVNSKNKEQALLDSIITSLDTASSVLLEQSFLQGINEVLNNKDGAITGLVNQFLELPSRAVPTVLKQIADLVDDTQRTTYEYNNAAKTTVNSIVNKIPGLSKNLAPAVDTLGREIKKYGGKNNLFNVFLNPANVNTENISESAKEIYEIYKATGETSIMPRVAPYYINTNDTKIELTSKQKSSFQKVSGDIIENNVKYLKNNTTYKNLSNEEKAEVINNIVNYSYNKAREEVLNIEMSDTYNKVNKWVDSGGNVYEFYATNHKINLIKDKYNNLSSEDKAEVTKAKRSEIFEYINSQNISKYKKILLYKMAGYSITNYKDYVFNYINNMNLSISEKEELYYYLYEK